VRSYVEAIAGAGLDSGLGILALAASRAIVTLQGRGKSKSEK